MNASPRERESDFAQYVRYLLYTPILFAVGFGLAKLVSPFVGEDWQQWLDPVNWGGILAAIFLLDSLPTSDPVYASFGGPKPPNNRRLAVVRAISSAVYFTAVLGLLTYWNRGLWADGPWSWLISLLAILIPIVAVVGSWRRYREYVRQSENP